MRRVVVSHPFGNPHSYNAALAFHEEKLLSCFHTSRYSSFGGRNAPVRTHPRGELTRLAAVLLPSSPWLPRMIDRAGTAFDRTVAQQISGKDDAVFTYEDWAYHSLLRSRELGLLTLYESSSPYSAGRTGSVIPEVECEPALRRYSVEGYATEANLLRRERELSLADVVICPSTYVKKSIAHKVRDVARVHVIPSGVDIEVAPKSCQQADFHWPLRLVSAGPLAPKQGLHHLFEALETLPPHSYSLTLAGRWTPGYRDWLDRRYRVRYVYAGSVPHRRLGDLVRAGQVLVLPSLHDAFGPLLLEAMAHGVPVIATDRTAAPDVIAHGCDGFLVRAGNAEDLRKALERCLDDAGNLEEMGRHARQTARKFTWRAYRLRLIAAFESAAAGAFARAAVLG